MVKQGWRDYIFTKKKQKKRKSVLKAVKEKSKAGVKRNFV